MLLSMDDFLPGCLLLFFFLLFFLSFFVVVVAAVVIKCFMIGVNV